MEWNEELDERFIRADQFDIGMTDGYQDMIFKIHENKVPLKNIAKAIKKPISDVKDNIKERKRFMLREEAYKQGKRVAIKGMIVVFNKNNIPLEAIAKSANLSVDEVKDVINEYNLICNK